MAIKTQPTPGSVQFNKLFAELPEKGENIQAQFKFRHDLLESQKRINYQNEFDRLQGSKKLSGLDPHVKGRMQELHKWLVNHLKVMATHIEFILQTFNLV